MAITQITLPNGGCTEEVHDFRIPPLAGNGGKVLAVNSGGTSLEWTTASSGSITVDSTMSDTSTNPVQNRVIFAYIDSIYDSVEDDIQQECGNKQDTLVSGTNIKTINNTSLLGSGNITTMTQDEAAALDGSASNTVVTDRAKVVISDGTRSYTVLQMDDGEKQLAVKLTNPNYCENYILIDNSQNSSDVNVKINFEDYGTYGQNGFVEGAVDVEVFPKGAWPIKVESGLLKEFKCTRIGTGFNIYGVTTCSEVLTK